MWHDWQGRPCSPAGDSSHYSESLRIVIDCARLGSLKSRCDELADADPDRSVEILRECGLSILESPEDLEPGNTDVVINLRTTLDDAPPVVLNFCRPGRVVLRPGKLGGLAAIADSVERVPAGQAIQMLAAAGVEVKSL